MNFLHLCGVLGAVAGLALGLSLPDPKPSPRYNLVQVVGDESDIIDHDQTATDCGFAAFRLAKAGKAAFCEVAR